MKGEVNSQTANSTVLDLEGVTSGYIRGVPAISEVSVSLRRGEIVAIVGPNGAGKSTVLKAIVGLVPCWKGKVRLRGETIDGLPIHDRVARGLAFVPQGENVFPHMNVRENLQMAVFGARMDEGSTDDRLDTVLELFPTLRQRLMQRAESMSGGEQQMVAVARALMTEPAVLLLDEPSLGLAPKYLEVIVEAIISLRQKRISVLLVEQNAAMALDVADRGLIMEMGQVRFSDNADALLRSSEVRRLYVGGAVQEHDSR